jgi:hypothetical protein
MDEFGQPVIDEMTGQPVTYQVTINPFDNHQIHIKEHENFQKTQEYEMLPAAVRKVIQDHVDEHKGEILKERTAVEQHQGATSYPGEGEGMPNPDPETQQEVPVNAG